MTMSMSALGSGDVSLRINPAKEGLIDPANGRVERRAVGGFETARIAHLARPTAAGGSLSPWAKGDSYLVLQLTGAARFIQNGQDATLGAGDIAVFDSEAALKFWFAGKQLQLVVCIPREVMSERCPGWEARCSTPFPRSGAALVSSVLHTAFEQAGSRGREAAIADALLTLVASALDGLGEPEGADAEPVPRMVREIQDSLLARLGDATLTPQSIARLHGLSERQLHRVFQSAGIGLGQWIRQARLDRCAADLRNAALHEKSITEIAFGWGFNDSAHFSRSFRAEYGSSPRDYRSAVLKRLPPRGERPPP